MESERLAGAGQAAPGMLKVKALARERNRVFSSDESSFDAHLEMQEKSCAIED